MLHNTVRFALIFVTIYRINGKTCNSNDKITASNQGNINFKDLDGNLEESTMETKYDAKGLQPFFNLANSFMNTVQPKSLSKELYGIEFDMNDDETGKKVRSYETPIIVAVAFGVLFMLVMPFVGMCFCCCRCCGKCGGKKFQDPKDAERHSKCFIMSVILVVIAIFMLCGVLFMFVTNNRTHDTAKVLGSKYENVVNNAVSIAESTIKTIESISNNFLPCLVDLIETEIGSPGIQLNIGNPLRDFVSNRVDKTLNNATKMSENINDIKTKLDGIKTLSDKLKSLGNTLTSEINQIKGKLDAVNCMGDTSCQNKIDDYKNQIDVTIDFANLPDIQNSIDKIKEIQDKNLTKLIGEARKIITDIPETTVTKSQSAVDEIDKALDSLTKTIESRVTNVTTNINKQIDERKPELLKYKEDYMDVNSEYFKYENYRWYAYFGLSGLMALIVLFIALGLALGICGYNKNKLPSIRSGAANCGGNCLMAAVGFMFIFSFFLMLFCVIWYVVGIHLYLGCRDLKDGQLFDNVMGSRLAIEGNVLSVETLLNGCRDNKPLYNSLGGETVFNISAKFNFKEYTDNIDQLLDDIKFDLTDQNILTQDTEDALNKAINSGVNNIDYAKFISTLKTSITQSNLASVAANVRAEGANYPLQSATFNGIADDLEKVDSTTLAYIASNITVLESNVNNTQKVAASMTTESTQLLADMKSAEKFIQDDTTSEIVTLVRKFGERIIGFLAQSTDFIVNQASNNLLRCKPIADLYDGLVNTLICDDIVQNANGFWLALGWCLLFFVVAIIFSVKLAKFYRRMDYDAGIDKFENPPFNDKIPLQSYEMNAPPPYQQHQNQGYHNQ